MSIIIKGMQLPKAEDEFVEICVYGDGKVIKTGESFRCADDKKCYYTPTTPEVFYQAVEIPKGHGRLIDADALGIGFAERKAFIVPRYAVSTVNGWNSAIRLINAAPTVIEAEE